MIKQTVIAAALGLAALGFSPANAAPVPAPTQVPVSSATAPDGTQIVKAGFRKFGHRRGFRRSFRGGFRGGFRSRGFRGRGFSRGFKRRGFVNKGFSKGFFFTPGFVIIK